MAITILLLYFISLYFCLGISIKDVISKKDLLLITILVFSSVLTLITEFSSILHSLNFLGIFTSWFTLLLVNAGYLFSKKEKFYKFTSTLGKKIKTSLTGFKSYEKFLLFSGIIILILIFIQGIAYAPNNYDSMTYHLSRIVSWLSHQSLEHYPTHIYRQINQPPFSEYVMMHFNVLSNGDYFSASVQFFFLLFSIVSIVSLVELFGISSKFNVIAILLAITIPEVAIQASSTQNDVVDSFFILTAVYFAIKSIKGSNYFFSIGLGLSSGLAILTKATAYIFLAPVFLIIVMVIIFKLYKIRNFPYPAQMLLAGLLCLMINSGYYLRNYKLNGNVLGTDKTEVNLMSNETMSPALLMSAIVKNAALHIGPYPLNSLSNRMIGKLHKIAEIDINDPKVNYLGYEFCGSPDVPNHEGIASNPIHFLLTTLAILFIGFFAFKRRKLLSLEMLYAAIIVLQAILFCYYLKWQPWHTRLHTPLFLLAIPLICHVFSRNEKYQRILKIILPVAILYALLVVLFNCSRPYFTNKFTSEISIRDSRFKKYFANRMNWYKDYNSVTTNIGKLNYKNIGLIIGNEDWEYPLFSNFYSKEINPIHICVSNKTKDIPSTFENIDCIVSSTINDSNIYYKGEYFYNAQPNNEIMRLYLKRDKMENPKKNQ